jgi:hypothetical protein
MRALPAQRQLTLRGKNRASAGFGEAEADGDRGGFNPA